MNEALMYSNNELQTVQLWPGGNYLTVSSSSGNWQQQNSVPGRSNKGVRGGQLKGVSVPVHTLTPIARQVAYIDANTGGVVTNAASQTFSRSGPPAQPVRQAALATSQPAVVQVQSFPPQGQLPQQQQVLQLHAIPAGPHVYKLTNGTRVVKAGQPYPNTTIVQTAVAVPAGSQQVGSLLTVRPQQSHLPPQQQQQHLQVAGSAQLQTNSGMGAGGGGSTAVPLQLSAGPATAGGTLLLGQQQQQQPQGGSGPQHGKVTLVHQMQPGQHILVATPQQTISHQQQLQQQHHQQQQQQQAKKLANGNLRQVCNISNGVAVGIGLGGGSGGGIHTIAVRPAALPRPGSAGPITLQQVFHSPPTTVPPRTSMRIPKLSTVATYNPVTGVRSATTANTPGGPALGPAAMLSAGLPASLVQQVQKASLLTTTQQQSSNLAGLNLQTAQVVQVNSTQPGQPPGQLRTLAPAGAGAGLPRTATVVLSGAHGQPTTQVISVVPGGGGGAGSVVGGVYSSGPQQQLPQPQAAQQLLVTQAGHHHNLSQQPSAPQLSQQQVVNITLADGSTATTLMDQTALARMLSDSAARGQPVKLQSAGPAQQQVLQQTRPGQAVVAAQPQSMQIQLQTVSLQPHQLLIQQTGPAQQQPQVPQLQQASGMVTVLGGHGSGTPVGAKGPSHGSGQGGAGGMERQGGLQSVHLTAAAPPGQLLIRNGSASSTVGNAGRGEPSAGPGGNQGATNVGNMQGQQQQQSVLRGLQVVQGGTSGQGTAGQGGDFLKAATQQQQQLESQQRQQRMGMGMQGYGEVDAAAAASGVFNTTAAFAKLQALSVQQQQQVQHHQVNRQQQQQLATMVEGLSLVDLDALIDQQQNLQQQLQAQQFQHQLQQQQQQQQHPLLVPNSVVQFSRPQTQGSGAALSAGGNLLGGLQDPTSISTVATNPSLGHLAADASVSALLAAPPSLTGGGEEANTNGLGVAAAGLAGGREDLKAILVSIGQELARHSISVETAVTSGWLGLLTAMDVAVLADAYAEEERRIMQHKNQQEAAAVAAVHVAAAAQQQQQHQQQMAAVVAAAGGGNKPSPPPQLHQQTVDSLPQGTSGTLPGLDAIPTNGVAVAVTAVAASSEGALSEGRSGASGVAAALLPPRTSSSTRTSLSMAPSEDGGASTNSCVDGASMHLASTSGGLSVGLYDRAASFNAAYGFGFFGGSGMSALRSHSCSGEYERQIPMVLGDKDESAPTAATLAEALCEKTWAPIEMTFMADEAGLAAAGAPGSGNTQSQTEAAVVIDSASEYEAQRLHGVRLRQVAAGPAPGLGQCATGQELGLKEGATCTVPGNGGIAVFGSGAAGGGDGGALCGAVPVDMDMQKRFANLDLGCGFY